jgi:hypothetical protein
VVAVAAIPMAAPFSDRYEAEISAIAISMSNKAKLATVLTKLPLECAAWVRGLQPVYREVIENHD